MESGRYAQDSSEGFLSGYDFNSKLIITLAVFVVLVAVVVVLLFTSSRPPVTGNPETSPIALSETVCMQLLAEKGYPVFSFNFTDYYLDEHADTSSGKGVLWRITSEGQRISGENFADGVPLYERNYFIVGSGPIEGCGARIVLRDSSEQVMFANPEHYFCTENNTIIDYTVDYKAYRGYTGLFYIAKDRIKKTSEYYVYYLNSSEFSHDQLLAIYPMLNRNGCSAS